MYNYEVTQVKRKGNPYEKSIHFTLIILTIMIMVILSTDNLWVSIVTLKLSMAFNWIYVVGLHIVNVISLKG